MHIVISWDVHAVGEDWTRLNAALRGCLFGYSWVKPLKTVYVVEVEDEADRLKLKNALIEVCRSHSKDISLLVSPPMVGGSYSGWLKKPLWEKIRKRTQEADLGF